MKDTAIIAIAAAAVPTILFLIAMWVLSTSLYNYERKLQRLRAERVDDKKKIRDLESALAEAQQDAINEGRIVAAQQRQISEIESLCSNYIGKIGVNAINEFWSKFNAITGNNAGGGS